MRLNVVNTVTARDLTGQKRFKAREVPGDYVVGDLVDRLLLQMQLNRLDQSGSPLKYEALLQREGRHLNRTEVVGDVFQQEDENEVVLVPRIMAG